MADLEEPPLRDSIRKTQASKRRPQVAELIAKRIAALRQLDAEGPDGIAVADQPKPQALSVRRTNLEDSLPLAPQRAARLGLTSILPPLKVLRQKQFQAFLLEITDPDFRVNYPTYRQMAETFGVTVSTIKTWLLSEEVSRAVEVSLSHEARLMMPSVMRSVRLRAETTGDPHAAEFVRKIAKLGTAETDAQKSFENTLRQIALQRSQAAKEAGPTSNIRIVDSPEASHEPIKDEQV